MTQEIPSPEEQPTVTLKTKISLHQYCTIEMYNADTALEQDMLLKMCL